MNTGFTPEKIATTIGHCAFRHIQLSSANHHQHHTRIQYLHKFFVVVVGKAAMENCSWLSLTWLDHFLLSR